MPYLERFAPNAQFSLFKAKFVVHCECFALIREMWTWQLPCGIYTAPFSSLRTNLDPNEQIRIQICFFFVGPSQTSLWLTN